MQEMTWKAWFQSNTDKFILLTVFAVTFWFVAYTLNMKMDEGAVDWARAAANTAMGWIPGIITGKYMAERAAEKKNPLSQQTLTSTKTMEEIIPPDPPKPPE